MLDLELRRVEIIKKDLKWLIRECKVLVEFSDEVYSSESTHDRIIIKKSNPDKEEIDFWWELGVFLAFHRLFNVEIPDIDSSVWSLINSSMAYGCLLEKAQEIGYEIPEYKQRILKEIALDSVRNIN